MLLAEPAETAWDLRWRMLGTNVRVHPLFWLVSAVLGWDACINSPGGGIGTLALWVACVFGSILLHEFGHVLMGRAFGAHGHIVLYGMGGLAIGSRDYRQRRWQRVLVLLAGPGVQLLLLVFLWGLVLTRYPGGVSFWKFMGENYLTALGMLVEINLFWPILNLLPIWPLDGGQITRELCEGGLGRRGVVVSLWLSILFAGGLAVLILLAANEFSPLPPAVARYIPRDLFMAFFFAYFAVGSVQALQAESSRGRWEDEHWWK